MKKLFKRVVCVVLAIMLIACANIPAFAADNTPVVLVPGVLNAAIYDASGSKILMPDFANQLDIESTLQALKDILHLQDTGAYEQATNELIAVAKGLFDPARCDENGKPVTPSYFRFPTGSIAADPESAHYSDESAIARKLAEKIGKKNVYIFTYDWRLDIVGIVDNSLAPYIEKIKKETGSDKVKIICASMGSAVTNTYLSKYSDRNDVEKVIFISGAGQGVQFVQDIYCTNPVYINRKAMGPYFKEVMGAGGAIGIAAVSRYLCDILQNMVDEQYEKVWTQFVQKDLLCWPSMWELAGHTEQMESILKSTKNEYFQSRIMEYYGYQDNLKNTLDSLKEKGVELIYTSNYNLTGVPATPNADTCNTDYLIDTFHTSNGATVADLGKTLGDNYTQKNDDGHNHISPDNVVDASTCYAPENTWFIKNLMHVSFGDKTPQTDFICWLALTDNVTIESDTAKYPQFMIFDKAANTLSPLVKVEITSPEDAAGSGDYISSAVTTYTYTQITALGWAVIIACAALIVILIAKKKKKGAQIEGVLTKAEIKALPKGERKAAKKQNKVLTKEWKKEQKAAAKARKAELKAMPKAERKAAKKADKAQKKIDKKAAKAAKKAGAAEAAEEVSEEKSE